MRITAVRKLAVEAADNGLLAPELATGITRVKGAKSKGVLWREQLFGNDPRADQRDFAWNIVFHARAQQNLEIIRYRFLIRRTFG